MELSITDRMKHAFNAFMTLQLIIIGILVLVIPYDPTDRD